MDPRELWLPDGAKILAERKRQGLSRSELAGRAGISPHTLARAEQSTPMFPATVRLIAIGLEIAAESIIQDSKLTERWSLEDQRHIDIVLQIYDIYNEAALKKDMNLIRKEMPQYLHPNVEWSAIGTDDYGYNGVFHGIDGVMDYFETSLKVARRSEPIRWDEIRPILGGQVLAVGSRDRVFHEEGKFWIIAKGSNLFTFKDCLVVAWYQSIVFLGEEPE